MHLPGFLKRPAHTLLYITEAKTFRVDCDRKGIIQGEITVIDVDCETSNTIPRCLDSIFKHSSGIGKKVWLLYSSLTTYSLSLPSVQVEGVDRTILEQALQFEYEGLTGNSVSNSHLAYHFVGSEDEMTTYWVNLIAKETLSKTKEILSKHHCKFAGLGHPGGLPFLLSGSDSPSWLRIECWPDCVYTLAKTPETGLSLQIIHTRQNEHWADEVDHWVLDAGAVDKSEAIMNNKIEYLPNTEENYRLTLDGALVFWLGLWAKHLIDDDQISIPLLNPQKSIDKEILYMLGGGLAALILSGGHFNWNMYFRNDFQSKLEALSNTDKEIQTLRKSVVEKQDKLDILQQNNSLLDGNINQIPQAIAALQQRPLTLLKTLADNSSRDLIIEQIQQSPAGYEITGVSLQPQLANQLASRIEADINALGWKLTTPTKKDMQLFSSGGPWEFTLPLEDLGLKGFIDSETQTP